MDHPFEEGKVYRNRKGEYVVVELAEPAMVIRYTDGSTLPTRVEVQARIWRNIQLEAAAAREDERRAASRQARGQRGRGGRAAPRGRRFKGLQETDFQAGVAGTCWRARTGLGGLLAEELTVATGREFQSYSVPRRPWVHIAQPDHYAGETKWREAKFVFGLDAGQATFGLYIERNNGPMDATWHWPDMMRALRRDERLLQALQAAMVRFGLRWQVHGDPELGVAATVTAAGDTLHWAPESDGAPREIGWPEFVARLDALDPDVWWNLMLVQRLPRAEVLGAGLGIAGKAASVYSALLPLYDASTGQGRFAR